MPARLLVLLLCHMPVFACAADWVLLRLPQPADEQAFDLGSVYIYGDEVTYWRRIRKADNEPAKRLLRERIQCSLHTLTTLTEVEFNRDGQRTRVATPYNRDPQAILAGSPEHVLEQAICRLIGRHGPKMPTANAGASLVEPD